jgi:hypothetical protein
MNQEKPKRLYFTNHARQRMRQRQLSRSTLHFVVDHGRRERSTDGIICSLLWADIPNQFKGLSEFAPTTQIRVVLDPRGRTVVTTYPRRSHRCYPQKAAYNQLAA